MIRKPLFAVSLALLAIGAGLRPAHADPKFLEPYGEIYSARTLLPSRKDTRPKDAVQAQKLKHPEANQKLVIAPVFHWVAYPNVFGHTEALAAGGSVAYASRQIDGHPWQLTATPYYLHTQQTAFGFDSNEFGIDATAKAVVWQGKRSTLPVVSVVGRFQHNDQSIPFIGFNRYDALLAVDQRVARRVFVTANAGYAKNDWDSGFGAKGPAAVATGVGITWSPMRKLSLSLDYRPDNVVDRQIEGSDFWTFNAAYAVDRLSSVRVGAGKHHTWLAQYIAKVDW